MAIDREFGLLNVKSLAVDRQELKRVARLASRRSSVVVSPPVATGVWSNIVVGSPLPALRDLNVAFIIPSLSEGEIFHAFESIQRLRENPYEALERAGIVVVNPARITDDGLLLSGGSLSSVALRFDLGRSIVTKSIRGGPGASEKDGIERHRAEAHFLQHASRNGVDLFPMLLELDEDGQDLSFSTNFVPAYTAAELVFQGRMSGERLGGLLIEVYEQLRQKVYTLLPVGNWRGGADISYVATIRRRTDAILWQNDKCGHQVRELLTASEVHVNGRECITYNALLDVLESDAEWNEIVRPQGVKTMCHGDLILEDILVEGVGRSKVTLVDPNPYNQQALFDVAKTLLSLIIGYEFMYFDLFKIDFDSVPEKRQCNIAIEFGAKECGRQYAIAATIFCEYVEQFLAERLGLKVRGITKRLRMAAALHALAIPWFHLTHHRRQARALAFVASGLFHATVAMDDQCMSLEEYGWFG